MSVRLDPAIVEGMIDLLAEAADKLPEEERRLKTLLHETRLYLASIPDTKEEA